jgi:hypothetical protein
VSRRDWHADEERLRNDLAAYSLGALGGREATDLALHLDQCAGCRNRLRWLAPAVDVLPGSVPQLSPPERLRENLLAAVRAEAAEPEPSRGSRWADLRALALRPAIGLTAVLLLAVGIAAGYLGRGTDQPAGQLVGARGLGPAAERVSAELERGSDSATLHVHAMPALRRGEVYEIWIQRDGVMEPAGTFVLGIDGTAEAAVADSLEGAEAVLVTAEREPGTRRPTSEPLLQAPLQ